MPEYFAGWEGVKWEQSDVPAEQSAATGRDPP